MTEWPASPRGKPRVVPVHLWYSRIEIERAYHIHGRVLFADTGKPAAGAGWNDPPTISPPAGTTGVDGRFTLRRLSPGKVSLWITPPADGAYLGVMSIVDLSAEHYEIEHAIELPRGEVVRGRVVDASSGEGLAGARIWYIAQQRPLQPPRPFVEKVQSADDGRFAIAVPPGGAELVVIGPVPGYVTYHRSGPVTAAPAEFHRPIDVHPGEPQAEVTFELQPKPNATLSARVIDVDGKPAEDVEILYQGFGEENGFGSRVPAVRTASDANGSFVLSDLEPTFEYDLRLFDRRRNRGAFFLLSQLEQPKTPLKIKLEPLAMAAGQLVDEQGRPLPGAVVRLYTKQGRSSHVEGEPIAADAEGRFEFPRLLPGATYSLETGAEGYGASTASTLLLLAAKERWSTRSCRGPIKKSLASWSTRRVSPSSARGFSLERCSPIPPSVRVRRRLSPTLTAAFG
ncbi:MAG TPA: carboxypeptidase regulatory-like domain-containing protein [Pirellulales bacterium]|nr:carboxypeptidase regulatory-like domain-containing protein [Pirellulales bacterium]